MTKVALSSKEQLIRLGGSTSVLEGLAKIQANDWAVGEIAGEFYLRSPIFAASVDPHEVARRGCELLAILSGISTLQIGTDGVVLFAAVCCFDEGVLTTHLALPFTEIAACVLPSASTEADSQAESQRSRVLAGAMRLANNEPLVSDALRLLGSGDYMWVNLYRIFEIIRSDAPARVVAWGTKRQITRFRRTANNSSASGDSARHGHTNDPPPADPMSVAEGRAFIESLVLAWIDDKLPPPVV